MNLLREYLFAFSLLCVHSLLLLASPVQAENKARPDAQAPINVVDTHTYNQGEWGFSYRYSHKLLDGNLRGSSQTPDNEILSGGNNSGNYLSAPTKMSADIHTLTFMYASSETNTFTLSLPYISYDMSHIISSSHSMAANETFNTQAQGLGDMKVASILTLEKTPVHSLLLNLGLSLPTGATDVEDDLLLLPALGKTQLPFPMQLGSGTFDILPGFTYQRLHEKRSWGTQLATVIRIGRNDMGYTLGNRGQVQFWHAWLINKELSFSTRLNLEHWDNVDGDNRESKIPNSINLNNEVVELLPNTNPQNQGGQRADIGIGFNGVYGKAEHRLGIELVVPVQQTLDGPQLEQDLAFSLGYQKSFD